MSLMGVAGVLAFAAPATAQTPVASANFNGYASGAVVHTGVLNSGPTTLAELQRRVRRCLVSGHRAQRASWNARMDWIPTSWSIVKGQMGFGSGSRTQCKARIF